MRFADLENIWTVDLSLLSNADRGRVYYERAKRIIQDTLADPAEYERAIRGRKFQRSYLVEKIGCKRGVTLQNPKIRRLLIDTDKKICLLLEKNNA